MDWVNLLQDGAIILLSVAVCLDAWLVARLYCAVAVQRTEIEHCAELVARLQQQMGSSGNVGPRFD